MNRANNIVENNNTFVNYNQVWSKNIFTDRLPENPPALTTAVSNDRFTNIDGTSQYTVYLFRKTEHEVPYDFLIYLSNFQLTKEFRQGKSWKLEYQGNEELLRRIVLPSTTISRLYAPKFSNGQYEIPYTSVDPVFNLNECRIDTGLDFDKLYFTGWLYIGRDLQDTLDNNLPPFDDNIQILKNIESGNRASFHVEAEARYNLPGDTYSGIENTILTTSIVNQALNEMGDLDEGSFW